MSSILEALKKLEKEKQARETGEIDINREILQAPVPRPEAGKKSLRNLLLAGIGLGFCGLLILVGWQLPRFLNKNPSQQEQTPVLPAKVLKSTLSGEKVASEVVRPAPSEPAIRERSFEERTAVLPIEKDPAFPSADKTPEKTAVIPVPLEQSHKRSLPASEQSYERPFIVSDPEDSSQLENVPLVSVSGIAFRGEQSSSLAIVNDQPMRVGTSMDGVTVEEIFSDKVRFSYEGKFFSLGIGDSTRDR